MEADEWRQIARWLSAADVDCIELSGPDGSVRMLRKPDGYVLDDTTTDCSPATSAPTTTRGAAAVAECVGVFLARHPAQTVAWPACGDAVEQGDVVGLLRIGLLLAPVIAPASGRLGRALVAHNSLVGYGTRLFDIDTGGA